MKIAFGCVACYFGEAGAHDSGLVWNASMPPKVASTAPNADANHGCASMHRATRQRQRHFNATPTVITPIARPPSTTGTEICARLRAELSS